MNEGWIVKNMLTGSLASQAFDSHADAEWAALKLNGDYQTDEFRVVGYREGTA
jgi:hypothetical protein